LADRVDNKIKTDKARQIHAFYKSLSGRRHFRQLYYPDDRRGAAVREGLDCFNTNSGENPAARTYNRSIGRASGDEILSSYGTAS